MGVKRDAAPWWADLAVMRGALRIPCPRCGAERGTQCKRGYPHAARARRSLVTAEQKAEAKRWAAEWNAMTDRQQMEHCRKAMEKVFTGNRRPSTR